MQRLKKGTTAVNFLSKKNLEKSTKMRAFWGTRAYKTAYEIG